MFLILFYALAGILVSLGLVFRVRAVLKKAKGESSNLMMFSIAFKVLGISILGYLIINFGLQNILLGLAAFFVPAMAIILWNLLAR